MGIETGKFKDLGQAGHSSIHDRLLTAIARSAEDLTNGRGWPEGVNALLADLGQITRVSRVWIFQTLELTEDHIIQDYTFEWAAGPEYVQIGLPYFSRFKSHIDQPEYRDMIQSRINGDYQKVLVGKLTPSWIKSNLDKQNILSMLTIPITVENQWWGTLGFDDCEREYDWTDAEIALLRTAGFLISSAVLRDSLSAKKKQLDILQKITACSAWQFDTRRGHLWCTSEVLGSGPAKTENLQFTFRQFLKLVHADDRKKIIGMARDFAENKTRRLRCDLRLLRECGDFRWVELTGEVEKHQTRREELIAGIALDITGRKDMEERLRHEATTDPLTGAVNRRKLELLLREETGRFTRTGQVFSLVMMDLDHFKQLNDTYGHAVGDMVLCHFTDICMGCLRKADHLSRIGGEEFAVLLPDTCEADAFDIASRIRRAVKDAPYSHDGRPVPYTISAGCAELKDQYSEPATLMNIADAALYRAKKSGRDRVIAASSDNCGISGL